MSAEISGLLTNDVRRHAMRKRAYAASRSMTWAETAKRYNSNFEAAREQARPASCSLRIGLRRDTRQHAIPDIKIGHFLSLCDSTGMLQHAVHTVADRAHGYCVDDNARALLLSSALAAVGDAPLSELLTARFAAFIQHAWNPDKRRFRNFMSFDRRWLEDMGSEDSHARTLWALGECARVTPIYSGKSGRPYSSEPLFRSSKGSHRPEPGPSRFWGSTLIVPSVVDDFSAERMRRLLADRLTVYAGTAASEPDGWPWFESVLAYDNARLPQALIQTGLATRDVVLRRSWPAVPSLAHGYSDSAVGLLQAGRIQ